MTPNLATNSSAIPQVHPLTDLGPESPTAQRKASSSLIPNFKSWFRKAGKTNRELVQEVQIAWPNAAMVAKTPRIGTGREYVEDGLRIRPEFNSNAFVGLAKHLGNSSRSRPVTPFSRPILVEFYGPNGPSSVGVAVSEGRTYA